MENYILPASLLRYSLSLNFGQGRRGLSKKDRGTSGSRVSFLKSFRFIEELNRGRGENEGKVDE